MDQIKGRQECINLEEAPLSYILSHIMEERLISLQLFQGQVVVCTKRLFALLDAQDPTLRRVLEDESIKKVVFSLKEVAKLFPSIKGVFDTQLAAHLLLPGAPVQDIKDLYIRYVKKRPPIVNPSDLFSVFLNLELYPILSKAVEEECVKDSLHSLEMPLSYVLAKMEQRGIVIDKERLQSLRDVLLRRLEDVQAMIYKEAGCVFNINSPKQLSQILFERLRLPKKKKTKTGYCTAEQVLQQLSAHHPLPARIMEYREVQKMLANYVEALLRTVGEDGRVHTCISQVSTSTGRLSVSSPPLQTIPQKGEFAKALRAVFVPAPGYRFIACDYSQMELRVFAHLSGDKALCKAFEEGKDFHTECATQLFGNSNERVKAKIVNFGILYGMSPYGLAKELGTSTKEAEEVIKEYFKRFPAASSYIREVLEFVHKNGYVQTLFGRRRYIPHINSANASLREFAKRAAINTVVQGTAAEIMKYAMLKVQHLLEDGKAHLLLQIHDELLFEVEEESLPELEEKIKECMETVITLSVPLIVRTRTGLSLEEVG
jgi:DNA polymerase-1